MRILDVNNLEITNPDLNLGHLEPDKIFLRHHAAVEPTAEVGHYEVIALYPETGGKDVAWVVDVPGTPAKEAWDEYEEILRYIPYTPEELEALARPTLDDRVEQLEAALDMILSGVTQ